MHSCTTLIVCQISMVKVYYLESHSHPSGCHARGVVSHPCHPCRLGFHQEKNLVASWHPPLEPGASTEIPADRSKTCQRGITRQNGCDGRRGNRWVSDEEMESWNAAAVLLLQTHTHTALGFASAAAHTRLREGVCECAPIRWMLQRQLLSSPGLFMQWWERVRERKRWCWEGGSASVSKPRGRPDETG